MLKFWGGERTINFAKEGRDAYWLKIAHQPPGILSLS